MKHRLQSGFTLLELLVVIAIIGILASVILSSVNVARNKAHNAAIKSNFMTLRTQAEVYFNANNFSYGTLGYCTVNINGTILGCVNNLTADPTILETMKAIVKISGNGWMNANVTGSTWAAFAKLKTSETVNGVTYVAWCVDSTGASKGEAALPPNNVFVCP